MSSAIGLSPPRCAFERVIAWPNLLAAWRAAARGKRGKRATAAFEHQLADRLLALQQDLSSGAYQPGDYKSFHIHEPKRRLISAAPFRDRVVHHALCQVIEPVFEAGFNAHSYANRVGKGTHKAIRRVQQLACSYRYALRLDIVEHFASIDHALLYQRLAWQIDDPRTLALAGTIIDSGRGVLAGHYTPYLFPGDTASALQRPRGLPIGNLTSQFWSNCYLDPLDHFLTETLGCQGYARYVDDLALFADTKTQLWDWKTACRDFLAGLRQRLHEHNAQVVPCEHGIPWLGFVVYPQRLRLKSRHSVHATRRLKSRYHAWQCGEISFGELDASVKGWVNHAVFADSRNLRWHVLTKAFDAR
ncbi:MAG: group II intron reverse transcriptase domain-containing protein [Candidatus Competibacteraceae bacterium]|nr:group II intron reverse transcriptase domain-containing protein [Candidatus Competibacteraceae bacterium]